MKTGLRLGSFIVLLVMLLTGCGKTVAVISESEEPAQETVASTAESSAAEESQEEKEGKSAEELEAENKAAAEEAARQKAEEEEAARKKAEEEEAALQAAEEEQKKLNSFSMMYYLAITAEEIRTSSDNPLVLADIKDSLYNDINPEIDERTIAKSVRHNKRI